MINPYYPGIPFTNFKNLDKEISQHYDRVYDTVVDYDTTPRFMYEFRIGFRDIFYCIDRLYDNNPESVIDVGCGECIWKQWFPSIIGFDPTSFKDSHLDFIDYFDEHFSKNHTANYDCGMALNSLHFISWDGIPDQINLAMNTVQDRFLFTFNFSKLEDKPTENYGDLYINLTNILKSMNYDIKLLDYPELRGVPPQKINHYGYINGHARFMLAHKI